MKKSFLAAVSVLVLGTSLAYGKDKVSELKGKGLDGKDCSVRILQGDRDFLKNVDLQGASKVFEILSDTPDGYRPTSRIDPRGGEEVLSVLNDNPRVIDAVRVSRGTFSDSITYTLDSSDLPPSSEDELKGIKFKLSLKLNYKNNVLTKVKAEFKAKALLVTLASSEFECSK